MKTNRKSFNRTSSCVVSLVSLCTAVLLSSFTVLASGPGSGNGTDGEGFAIQEIAKSSGLSVYEQFIKSFKESANNKINLEWEASRQLDNGVVLFEATKLIKGWHDETYDAISLFYPKKDGSLEHVTDYAVIYLSRKVVANPVGAPTYETPNLTIDTGRNTGGLRDDSRYLVKQMDVLTTLYSITTPEDPRGHKWEVRQYNPKTVIFVKYPDKNNSCGEYFGPPQNGYCMIGIIFNNK